MRTLERLDVRMGFLGEAGEMLSVQDSDPPFVGKDGVDALERPLRAGQPSKKELRSIIVRAENTDHARVIAGGRRFAYGRGLGLRMERLSLSEGPGSQGGCCTNTVARKYVSAGKSV